jgi:chromatin remodeling complex protein RSC6
MSEQKGLKKPVKLKKDLADMLGVSVLSRIEVNQKIWEHIKANNLQTQSENGKPSGKGKFIVVDKILLSICRNTNSTSKSGNVTDLRDIKEGQTITMMQVASVVGANVES